MENVLKVVSESKNEIEVDGNCIIKNNLDKANKAKKLALKLFPNANFEFEDICMTKKQISNYVYISEFNFETEFQNENKKEMLIDFLKLVDYFDISPINGKELQISFSIKNVAIKI